MTRQEAIEALTSKDVHNSNIMLEALDMAIEALEQEPCEDAVSRQDVLNLAKKGVLISNGNYNNVCKAINELSSVTPKGVTVTDFADKCRECGKKKTRWIPVNENPPKNGAYYVTRKTYRGSVIGVASYAKDLYPIDRFDFADKKGEDGWYQYDYEGGYYEVTESIIAWMPLPKPYVPDINVGKMAESEE